MHELNSTAVIQGFENQLHKWLPEIKIFAGWETGGGRLITRPLLVFTEIGGKDNLTGIVHNPNDPASYPHVFIENLTPSNIESQIRQGRSIRTVYNDLYRFEFNIDIKPLEAGRIPRLNEELNTFALKLSRVLQEIPYYDAILFPQPATPNAISGGVLHVFRNVRYHENSIPEEHEKVETLKQKIKLEGDVVASATSPL